MIGIEELEGREAYKRGERWQSSKPELWRKGWMLAQEALGLERQRELPEFYRPPAPVRRGTRKPIKRSEREIDAAMVNAAKQIEGGEA